MHLVSEVKGRLADGLGAVDVLRAGFPAGTVSGSPKVRAMEIIDELEPARRGPYAGAVGYFDRGGDMEMCIAIRTLMARGRRVSVQAGGGLVYDSVPEAEYQETLNKARAVFTAVAQAESRLLDAVAAPPGARIAAARTPPAAQRRPRRRGKRWAGSAPSGQASRAEPTRVLLLDNYDSFTFNLVQYLGELGAEVEVFRNDAIDVAGIRARRPRRARALARARARPTRPG